MPIIKRTTSPSKVYNKTLISLGLCILLGGLAVFLSGCSEETAVAPGDVKTSGETTIVEDFANAEAKSANIIRQDGSEIPAEIAEVMVGDGTIAREVPGLKYSAEFPE